MFRHDYPYTDFHELNMDWFLNEFKSLLEEWAAQKQEFETLKEAWNDLREFVTDYFENLDVQEEINNKLDEMASDGSLAALLAPFVTNMTAPRFASSVDDMTDPSRIYVLRTNGLLYYYDTDQFVNSGLYYAAGRNVLTNTGVSLTTGSVPAGYDDANNFPNNTIIACSATLTAEDVANLPKYGQTANIITFAYRNSDLQAATQLFNSYKELWFRECRADLTWTDWERVALHDDAIHLTEITLNADNATGNYADADTFPIQEIVGLSAALTAEHCANLPYYGTAAIIMTYNFFSAASNTQKIQLFHDAKHFCIRHWVNDATPDHWIDLYNNKSVGDNYFCGTAVKKTFGDLTGKHMYIFGDSITTASHGGFTWGGRIAGWTGAINHNYGRIGAGFVGGSSLVIDQITPVTMDNADIVFVAAGTNDANSLARTGAEMKTAIDNIVSLIRTKTNAEIIFITPIRRNYTVTENIMLPMVAGAICNAALQNDCSVINGFDFPIATETTDWYTELTDGDGTHPNAIGKNVYARCVLQAIV